jgi:hypothetical protein
VEPEPQPEPEPEIPDDAPSEDPLIDDFDRTPQLRVRSSREGYWFTSQKTGDGTITAVADALVEEPADNYALHAVAQDYVDAETWAVFGAKFNGGDAPVPPYVQAAQYSGLRFWACSGAGSSSVYLEVVTTDTSSEYDDGNEDNHYRYAVELSAEWELFEVPWDDPDLVQLWGTMRSLEPSNVAGFQFNLFDGETGYDIWLDDVEFIEEGVETTVESPRKGPCPGQGTAAADSGAG